SCAGDRGAGRQFKLGDWWDLIVADETAPENHLLRAVPARQDVGTSVAIEVAPDGSERVGARVAARRTQDVDDLEGGRARPGRRDERGLIGVASLTQQQFLRAVTVDVESAEAGRRLSHRSESVTRDRNHEWVGARRVADDDSDLRRGQDVAGRAER